MPVIELNKSYLKKLLSDLPSDYIELDKFKENITMLGASVEREDKESLFIEFFPNRPDLYSVEGVARAFKSFITGIPLSEDLYKIKGKSGIEIKVDRSIIDIRPYIGGVLVKRVQIDENSLVSLMNIQEKLHLTLGRGREKMAIGIHDFSPLHPPFKYLGVKPRAISFLPLLENRKMNLEEILKEHDKGVQYRHLLEGFKRYPVILDQEGQVLSFPPIINGELTRITEKTKDVFVDCTGTSFKSVEDSLKIVTAQLIDLGGKAYSVDILYPKEHSSFKGRKVKTPTFNWEEIKIDQDDVNRVLGLEVGTKEAKESLRRLGHKINVKSGTCSVKIPPMRVDILHPVDLFEDLAIGYGFERFKGILPRSPAFGEGLKIKKLSALLREGMIGLGYQEVKTLTLVDNQSIEFLDDKDKASVIVNPISDDHSILRPSLYSSLLSFLKMNRHRDLPQRIFEIGEVTKEGVDSWEMGLIAVEKKIGFTDVKSIAEYIFRLLSVDIEVQRLKKKIFIPGRGARIIGGSKNELGEMGEIRLEVLEKYQISYPAIALRLDMEKLILELKS